MAKRWGGDRGWWGDAGGVTVILSGPTAGVTSGWERTQKGGGARHGIVAGPPGLTARRVARDRPVLVADVACRRFPRFTRKRDRPTSRGRPRRACVPLRWDQVAPRPAPRLFPSRLGGVNQTHVRGGHGLYVLVRYAPLIDHPTLVQTDIVITELVHLVRAMGDEQEGHAAPA